MTSTMHNPKDMELDFGIDTVELASDKDDANGTTPVSTYKQTYICRQFDRRVLPIVCALYILSYLDRGNIGNAKTAGAQTDLHLTSSQWAWVLNAFYICYTTMEWTNMLWKIYPAHVVVSTLCVLWGVAAMCSGAVHNMAGLVVCRSFLGVFEAAFGAGAPYYLSMFYSRRELGLRVSILLGCSPLANCFAAVLAYGITQIKGSLEPWRLLFLIEGAPTIAFAAVVWFFLPDGPSYANFLSEDDQTLALERLDTVDQTAKSKLSWSQYLSGLTDYQNYIHAFIHFSVNYSFAALSNFLPSIVKSLGYTSVQAQGLTAPPYLGSFICCVIVALVSDRYGKRGFIVAGSAFVGSCGYLILIVVEDPKATSVRYAGIWLATIGMFPALAINITWLLNNQQGDSKRGAGLAILATFGQCSSFVSSTQFPTSAAPIYKKGCAIGCGLSFLVVVLALVLHVLLVRENKKRDRLYGKPEEGVRLDVTRTGDKNKNFRYFT